jgi:subtilisin family serine protease
MSGVIDPRSFSIRRMARVASVMLTVGAMTLASVADGFAQRGGFGGGRGLGGDGMRSPGNMGGGGRFPGNDGPRYPGGGSGPRFPGGGGGVIMLPPGGYGPGGPGTVVVVDDDDPSPQRRKTKRVQKPTQPQKQLTQRGGFNAPPASERRFVPNEVLLNISANTSGPALDAIARRHRLTRLETHDFTLTRRRLARLRINDNRPVAAVIRSLRTEVAVLGANPNHLFAVQQDTSATSAATDSTQYALAKLRLPQAHALAKGASILVAVVDTTVDATHPDLAGVIAASFDATGIADRAHAHGTGIASVIAAKGKLTGAAPAVKVLAVQAFGSAGSSGTSLNILKGLEWAGKAKANVFNMSFAGPADAELDVMLKALRGRGAVLIAAAGNAGPNSRPLYPAASSDVIAVTATDPDDRLFAQANRGTHIAVAAPGVNILAAAPNGSYQMHSGTSFAAAQVSGIAALLLERNPRLDVASIRRILMSTARDLGPAGHDEQFGSGLADALGAVMSASPKSSEVSGSAAVPGN